MMSWVAYFLRCIYLLVARSSRVLMMDWVRVGLYDMDFVAGDVGPCPVVLHIVMDIAS